MRTPNFYKQYDRRWAWRSWRGQTLRAHGCGPTAICNVVSAMTALNYSKLTPADTWKWICDHGYMTVGHGTIWDGITKCLEHYGVESSITTSKATVKKALQDNNFAIPLMGPGLWTRGGHFITAYYVDAKGYIYISDPASNSATRQKSTFERFWSQCKRTWLVIDTSKYFAKDPSKPKGSERYSLYVYDKDGYAYVRNGRGTSYKAVAKLPNGRKLKLKNYSDGWYHIASGKYKNKYISEKVLSTTKTVHDKYRVLVNLRVRDAYSKKGKVLRTVKKGTQVTAAKQRGRWVYVPAVKGWMCTESSEGKKYMQRL